MNDVSSTSNGTYQYIEFAENIVECSQNTNGINIIGYNGIYIDKNITNYNGILTFNFIENNLKFGSSSVYIRNNGIYGNIIFLTSSLSTSIIIDSLPSGIIASHSTSNISLTILLSRSFLFISFFLIFFIIFVVDGYC